MVEPADGDDVEVEVVVEVDEEGAVVVVDVVADGVVDDGLVPGGGVVDVLEQQHAGLLHVFAEHGVDVAVAVDVADRHREAAADAGGDDVERPFGGRVGGVFEPDEIGGSRSDAVVEEQRDDGVVVAVVVDVGEEDPVGEAVGGVVADEGGGLDAGPVAGGVFVS